MWRPLHAEDALDPVFFSSFLQIGNEYCRASKCLPEEQSGKFRWKSFSPGTQYDSRFLISSFKRFFVHTNLPSLSNPLKRPGSEGRTIVALSALFRKRSPSRNSVQEIAGRATLAPRHKEVHLPLTLRWCTVYDLLQRPCSQSQSSWPPYSVPVATLQIPHCHLVTYLHYIMLLFCIVFSSINLLRLTIDWAIYFCQKDGQNLECNRVQISLERAVVFVPAPSKCPSGKQYPTGHGRTEESLLPPVQCWKEHNDLFKEG